MHIFLQGPKRIGKSTVISKTLDILSSEIPIVPGGFFTWNGGRDDPHVYMRPVRPGGEGEIYRLASYDFDKGGLAANISAFEEDGVRILSARDGADLIIMDELGFLESKARLFRQAVLETLEGQVPVLGVLRLGDIPWHEEIKRSPLVSLADVNENSRDYLPRELVSLLKKSMLFRERGVY